MCSSRGVLKKWCGDFWNFDFLAQNGGWSREFLAKNAKIHDFGSHYGPKKQNFKNHLPIFSFFLWVDLKMWHFDFKKLNVFYKGGFPILTSTDKSYKVSQMFQ